MRSPDYDPPRLLRNAHLQSALASLRPRALALTRGDHALRLAEDLIVECADGTRLLAHHSPPHGGDGGRTAVLLHGWEGSSDSLYMLSAAQRLWSEGYRVIRLNMRDHGASHHLNRGIFHSCRLREMIEAVRWLGARFSGEPLHLVGFSLGGNFALRIAAEPGTGLELAGVVSVCPVLDPAQTMTALDGGWAAYRIYFLRKWRRSLALKARAFPADYQFGDLRRFQTLEDMTAFFVTRYTEFPDLAAYLRGYAITGERLATLRVPAVMLLAEDDPVIPIRSLAEIARPAALRVDVSRHGGHCGFLADLRLYPWLDDYVGATLAELRYAPAA